MAAPTLDITTRYEDQATRLGYFGVTVRDAGGQAWELRDAGKGEKSMILDYRGTTVVLTGGAQLDEFAVLAAAVVGRMHRHLGGSHRRITPTA